MKEYSVYLFDVDGTLIDTAELIYECFKKTCRKFSDCDVSKEKVIAHIGIPLNDQLRVYLGELGDEKLEEIRAFHMSYQLSIFEKYLKTFPGIPETLRQLCRAGKRLGAVTSRMPETTEKYLAYTGIRRCFEAVVTPVATRRHKPHPEPALKAMEMLGVSNPGDALFVGDARFDIECGARAGMDTAFVAWSSNSLHSIQPEPTVVIDRPEQLLAPLDARSGRVRGSIDAYGKGNV